MEYWYNNCVDSNNINIHVSYGSFLINWFSFSLGYKIFLNIGPYKFWSLMMNICVFLPLLWNAVNLLGNTFHFFLVWYADLIATAKVVFSLQLIPTAKTRSLCILYVLWFLRFPSWLMRTDIIPNPVWVVCTVILILLVDLDSRTFFKHIIVSTWLNTSGGLL